MGGILPVWRELRGALEQRFLLEEVERSYCSRGGKGMARVRVAVEQLDGVFRTLHEAVIDLLRHDDPAHRHGGIGESLRAGDQVRRDAEGLRSKSLAGAPKACDHLVED